MTSGSNLSDILVVFVCILLSMSLHEAVHAFTAHYLGDSTASEQGRLTLNPLKHIDVYTTVLLPLLLIAYNMRPFFAAKPVPFNPDRVKHGEFGAAMVAVMGPLTNLVLAILAACVIRIVHPAIDSVLASWLATFVYVNVGFFVFNMIPMPPLDGSRLFYAFAPEPIQGVMRFIESLGFMSIVMFMILLYPALSPVIGFITDKIAIFLLG